MAPDRREIYIKASFAVVVVTAVCALGSVQLGLSGNWFYFFLGLSGSFFGLFLLTKVHTHIIKPIARPLRQFKTSYMLVLAATYLFSCENGLLFITLPIYINDITHDLRLVGLVVSLPFLAIFVMSFVWGAVTDRLGTRRSVIMWAMLIMGLMFLPMPYVDIVGLIGIRAVQVIFYSASILGSALVTEYVPRGKGEAVGEFGMWGATGWLTGGVLSGIIYLYGDVTTLFPVTAIVTCTIFIIMYPVREIKKEKAEFSLGTMFKFVKAPQIGLIYVVVMLTYVGNNIVFTLFPIYLKDLSLTEDLIGILTAMGGLIGALLVLFVGRFIDMKGRRGVFIFAIFLYFFDWCVLVVTENIFLVTMIWVIPNWALVVTSGTAMVGDLTKVHERGRGMGAVNSALNLGQFIGALSSGILAGVMAGVFDLGPFRGAYLAAALFMLLPFALSFRLKETLKKRKR